MRLAAVPRMPYEDFTWSFAVVMAIVSTAIPCTLLVDRVEVLSSTSARDLRPLRVVGFASASVLTQWPAVLLLVGAPRVLVVAVCAQSAGLLGLSAVVGRFDTRLVVVPTAVTVALALLPGLQPLWLHPLLPTGHPAQLQAAQWLVWAGGGVVWTLTATRSMGHGRAWSL